MILGVTGSRDWDDYYTVHRILKRFIGEWEVEQLVTGGARGADTLAEVAMKRLDPEVKRVTIRPKYSVYGPKRAPLIRNLEIVDRCDYLIAFWDGRSAGTKFTIDAAVRMGKPYLLVTK